MPRRSTEGESADYMLKEFIGEALYAVEGWNPPRFPCRLHKRHSVVFCGIQAVVLAARLENEFGVPPGLIRLADGVELRLDGFAKALSDRAGDTAQLSFSLDVERGIASVAVAQLLLEWADRNRVVQLWINGVTLDLFGHAASLIDRCVRALRSR